jgi:cell division protein FtsW (lipid II flippase)
VAPLLVAAVGLALAGLVVVSAAVPDSAADGGSLPVAIGGLVLSLAGFVALLAALARWSRRARRRTAVVHRPRMTVGA